MSVERLECYDYIIGLYSGDCECYDSRPDDYNESDSGLFLADLMEPKFISALLNCDQGSGIWDLMVRARNLAIKNFIGDTNALLLKSNKLKRTPYYGALGRAVFTKSLTLTAGHYAGVRMFCADIVSGYMKVKSIGTLFDVTGPLTLWLYDKYGTLLQTFNLTTLANRHQVNAITPITLELHDKYLNNCEYFWIYQVGAPMPKNNDLVCSCERWLPVFNTDAPYYYSTSRQAKGWSRYLMAGGINSAAMPNFMDYGSSASNYMYGLTFEIELGCKVGEVLCKDQLDFDGNTLAQAMALAIQRKAVVITIDAILGSQNLNRLVMIDREELLRKKAELEESYLTMVNFIAENVDITANDCFECRNIVDMIKIGIMA